MRNIFDKHDYKSSKCKKWPWGLFRQFAFDLKCCRQRIKYGWCEKDTRDIAQWFLEVVPSMLQHHKDHRMGSPAVLEHNDANEGEIEMNDACHTEWDRILEEMIHLFNEANEETCSRKNPYEVKFKKDRFHEKYYEEERKLEDYRNCCKDKGLELFGKWFWYLWD